VQYIDNLPVWNISPQLITFNQILLSLGRYRMHEELIRIFDHWKDLVGVDADSYNAMLNAFQESNNIQAVVSYFQEMKNRGIKPNSETFMELIRTCINHRIEERTVMNCLYEMYSTTKNSHKVLMRLIEEYSQPKLKNLVMEFIRILKHNARATELNTDMFNSILKALCQIGTPNEILEQIMEMGSKNIPRTVDSYNYLLAVYVTNGDSAKMVEVCQLLRFEQLEPDIKSYTLLIQGFAQQSNVEQMLLYFEEMKLKGFIPNGDLLHQVCLTLLDHGTSKQSKKYTDELYNRFPEALKPDHKFHIGSNSLPISIQMMDRDLQQIGDLRSSEQTVQQSNK